MADCQALSSHTQNTVLITKNNLYELIPDTYARSTGTEVTVSCVSGLRLVGSSTFTCESNGQWSYSSKPYCTDEPEQTDTTTEDALDDTSKIIIGVVCAIAALIVIALICMIVVILYRDRRRRRERREFWESIREERQGPEFRRERLIETWQEDQRKEERVRGAGGPSTIDMEMYNRLPRVVPPPPYDYRSHDRDIERPRDQDRGSRGSRLSNPIYLPGHGRPDYKGHKEGGRKHRKAKSYDDLSETGKKPYVRDWVSRNSMTGTDEYGYGQPGIHGGRQSRDAFLWRQANY